MMNGRILAASPGPPGTPTNYANKCKMLNTLLQFQQKGLFTDTEIRMMVFKEFGVAPSSPALPSPKANNISNTNSPAPHQITKCRNAIARLTFAAADSPKPKKSPRRDSQPGEIKTRKKKKPNSPETIIRGVIKNTVRQRFFAECCNEASRLWFESRGGKMQIDQLLFQRAAQDVEDILYQNHPGPLRKVLPGELRKHIHWQVGRDRNNWSGRTPKRRPFHGDELHFDWRGAYEDIQKAIANATDLTNDGDQVEEAQIPKVDKKAKIPKVVKNAKIPKKKS